jgi:type IV pilus assembly protein PilW
MATIKNCRLMEQRGFSLIELMITIPLGLLVMLAVLQIFSANIQGVNLQNAFSRAQENGRIATELLIRDIRGADYWGCLHDTNLITNHLDVNDPDYNITLIPTATGGLVGEDNVTSKAIATIPVKDTTDTLTLRGASTIARIKIVPPYMNPNAAVIHIEPGQDIPAGSSIIIGDCAGADLITVTSSNNSNGTIVHNTGTINIPKAVDNAFKTLSKTYSSTAHLMTPYVKTYFIGTNAAGGYSLFRSVDDGDAEELVRGVTDLQLLYGEDTNNNGAPDKFSEASAVTDMNAVRSIRFSLLAESSSGSGSGLAKTYSVTTNIRNRTLQ